MQLDQLDVYFRKLLSIDSLPWGDPSLNGLQVGRRNTDIKRIAFAVDAAEQVFQKAAEWQADMLFVHHGLFWGSPLAVCGTHYERLRFLMEHDIALYACHLPLDADQYLGNNAGMADALALRDREAFYAYKGCKIGIKGRLPEARSIMEISQTLFGDAALSILPFGPKEVHSIGIVSGGAPFAVHDAAEEGLDAFITGDASHSVYHFCREAGIHAIFGGHYLSEIWGVKNVAERIRTELGVEVQFLDIPTGL